MGMSSEQRAGSGWISSTSHYSEESYLFFLLARRACHTSAVLVKSGTNDKDNSK